MYVWHKVCTVVLPNTADLGTGEKPAVFQNGGIGRSNLKKPYLGLEMGGGIGREAVSGGAVQYWEGRL